ncbi:MAG: hypothetical protein NT142_15945 [Planctomycetota bacterium]|nr:hypothetical protein [Planctomycetota bacterium]
MVKLFTSLLLLLAWMPTAFPTAFCTCTWAGEWVDSCSCSDECCPDHPVENPVSDSAIGLAQTLADSPLAAATPSDSKNDHFPLSCPLCGQHPTNPTLAPLSESGTSPRGEDLGWFHRIESGGLDFCNGFEQKTPLHLDRWNGQTKLYLVHHCLLR